MTEASEVKLENQPLGWPLLVCRSHFSGMTEAAARLRKPWEGAESLPGDTLYPVPMPPGRQHERRAVQNACVSPVITPNHHIEALLQLLEEETKQNTEVIFQVTQLSHAKPGLKPR